MHSRFNLLDILMVVVVFCGLVTIISIINSARTTTRENNAIMRGVGCIISINAKNREQGQIEQCWDQVEKDTGVKVHRLDQSID